MKKTVRLTESDLIKLVQKIVKEQSYDESAFEEHIGTIDHIANHFNNETTEDELDFMLSIVLKKSTNNKPRKTNFLVNKTNSST